MLFRVRHFPATVFSRADSSLEALVPFINAALLIVEGHGIPIRKYPSSFQE